MTAKEEAKALAEKWLAEDRSFEMLMPHTAMLEPYWIAAKDSNFNLAWRACVGIRLLFEA